MWKYLAGAVVGAGVVAAVFLWGTAEHSLQSDTRMPIGAVPDREPTLALANPEPPSRSGSELVASADPASIGSGDARQSPSKDETRMHARSVGPLDVPGGRLAGATAPADPLDSLLSSTRITCQFGPGAGGNWAQGIVSPHTAAWQGGPITIDMIDVEGGKARMWNGSGLMGTPDGELDVKALATVAGLHFTVIKANGELLLVTIYPGIDVQRRYQSAISMHGPGLSNETAQFYGGCTN